MARDERCTPAARAGRLTKARQFWRAAEIIELMIDDEAISDAFVTLCVHAGIAASDVICCAKLGNHHQGDSHHEAVALLKRADRDAATHLKRLLDMKTRSGYGAAPTSPEDHKRASRAAQALLRAAEAV